MFKCLAFAVSSLQQGFGWHRRRHSHACIGRGSFSNKNIHVPLEGSFISRRAYTCNGSGGASFITVMTRDDRNGLRGDVIFEILLHVSREGMNTYNITL